MQERTSYSRLYSSMTSQGNQTSSMPQKEISKLITWLCIWMADIGLPNCTAIGVVGSDDEAACQIGHVGRVTCNVRHLLVIQTAAVRNKILLPWSSPFIVLVPVTTAVIILPCFYLWSRFLGPTQTPRWVHGILDDITLFVSSALSLFLATPSPLFSPPWTLLLESY